MQQTPVEKYLEHLDNVVQCEPLFFMNNSLIEGLPGVTSIVYKDVPEAGYITALTYGLSLVNHPEWKSGRVEICICVKSHNLDWGEVVGFIANHLRGKLAFCYGEVFNFHQQISSDSEMDAFLIFAPSVLERQDYLNIDIGTDYKIHIAGLYPIYSKEIEVYNQIGLKEFWHHPHFDNYDVTRQPIGV